MVMSAMVATTRHRSRRTDGRRGLRGFCQVLEFTVNIRAIGASRLRPGTESGWGENPRFLRLGIDVICARHRG